MAVIVPVLANGKSIENADVTVSVMGIIINGLKKFMWSDGLPNKKGITGRGSDLVSYVNGKRDKSAAMTIMYEEYANIEAAVQAAGYDDLSGAPLFPVTVTFTDPTFATISYVFLCGFTTSPVSTSDGDTGTECEIPLFLASKKRIL